MAGAVKPPPIIVAQVRLKCPDGERFVHLPGPTADAALRKFTHFVPPHRCVSQGASLVQRGAASITLGATKKKKRKVKKMGLGAISEKRCPPLGMAVRFTASPGALVMYSTPPRIGQAGTVVTVPLPGGRKTCMRGPGGGLVYVRWDDGHTQGVSPRDLDAVATKPRKR